MCQELLIDVWMVDSHRLLQHRANARAPEEVRLLPRQVTAPLANLFPSRQATVGELSDKVLLNIFRYILDVSPRHWPRLVHTCRKWRGVVFASRRVLQLRLFCTYGTPVRRLLDCWPSDLHIVVEYGGTPELDPPAPEDEDNIMVLLGLSSRVTSISLTITSSLLEKLSTIKSPLSELENLNLLSRDSELVTLPEYFLWGPHISCLRLCRIDFPVFLPLLHTSRNLVDLQLHDIPRTSPISPNEFAHVLSGMAQLRSLSLHFLSADDYFSPSPLPKERIVLPVLNYLNFRGTTTYLEDMAAMIDAPRLGDIDITFLDYVIFHLSNLGQFIDRVELHKSHHRAYILSSEDHISITFTQTGVPTCLRLKLLCKSLPLQLSSMTRIRIYFPALFFNVEDLRIERRQKSRQEDFFNSRAWLGLITSFASVKWFYVSKDLLEMSFHALQSPHPQHDTVLPVLHKLYISQPGPPYTPLMNEIVPLMISRQLSGHPILVEYEQPSSLREVIKICQSTMYARYRCHYLLTCL